MILGAGEGLRGDARGAFGSVGQGKGGGGNNIEIARLFLLFFDDNASNF